MIEIPEEYRAGINANLSIDQRIALARKVRAERIGAKLSPDESKILRDILLIIAQDAEVRVRQALAETLATSPDAPHDIVSLLAKDDDLVASPILQLSEVLTAEDLVRLIQSQASSKKLTAIAGREAVPAHVCLALIEHGDEHAAAHLLRNEGADIPERGLGRIVDRFGKAPAIQAGVVDRSKLPPAIIEKIVSLVSGELLARMTARHRIPAKVSRRLMIEVRDRAILGFTFGLSSDGMMNLVDQLIEEDRLPPSLVFRSLIVGNVELVVHVIALQCQLSPQYVRDRLIEGHSETVEKLWSAAELPPQYCQLAVVGTAVLIEAGRATPPRTADACRFQIVERFLTKCADVNLQLDPKDAAFLEAARSDSLSALAEMD